MQRRVIPSLTLSLLLASATLAQDKDPPAKPGKPAQTDAAKEAPAREEHVIYVPFQNLKDVFEKDGASVLMPYAQFLQMWNRITGPIIPMPIKPPVPGVISRADYAGAVEGELVRLRATLAVEVLSDEWLRLPVAFGEAAVGEATSDDDAVMLRGLGDGNYELLAHGRGKHTVSFELVVRVQTAADGKSFTLNCPPAGASNLELAIAESDLAVQVTPRRTSQILPDAEKKHTKLRATLGSTDRIAVAWQPKSGGAAEMAGLANVTDLIEIDVGDGVTHTHGTFDFQILRGAMDSLVVTMPADQRLLDVQVPGLRDWQAEAAEDGRQRLVVRLHAPARDKLRLEVRTESPIPDGELSLAQFRAAGAARESGLIAVRSAEDVGLEFVAHESVTRIDAAEAPEPLRKPRSTFYKFFSPGFRLAVQAAGLEPRVSVDSFLTITAEKARLALHGDFKYTVSRAGIFAVRFKLPDGFNLDEVQCEPMDRHELATVDGSQVLTVYLAKKVLGELRVAVAASQARAVQGGDLELPLIEPLGVPREQGLVAVIAPDSLEVNSDPKRLESARPATPAELAARGFNPQPPQGSTVAAAFAFSRRPVTIGLTTRPRPRRTLATVFTVASVKEDVVQVNARINYDIQYAGSDTFRFAVPAAVADRVQIQGDGIKEKRKAEQPDEDGTVAWTVVLHTEALGARSFTVTYDEKLTVPEQGEAPVRIEPIRVLDMDRETGEMAVFKDRSLAIAAKAEGLEEIDSRELTQPAGAEQPYLSYRYFRHPARLALGVTKHELEGVVKTLVSRAYVEAVLTSEGPISVRARYLVKSSERQRLAVTLAATRVLGVTVAGRSVQPEKAPAPPGAAAGAKSYFINIARTTGPDEPFPIAIVYEAPPPDGGKLGFTDSLPLQLPRFEQGVKFQQLYARTWLPNKYRAVGEPPGFTNETRYAMDLVGVRLVTTPSEEPDTWFATDAATFDFRTAGHAYLYSSLTAPAELVLRYWHSPSMVLVASLAVLGVGLVLTVFRFEARVLVILIGSLAALLAGLFWPEAAKGWLGAARIGIAGVIALWLVLFLLRVRRAIPLRMAAAGAGTLVLSAAAGGAAAQPPPHGPPQTEAKQDAAQRPEDTAKKGEPDNPPAPDAGSQGSDASQGGGSHE